MVSRSFSGNRNGIWSLVSGYNADAASGVSVSSDLKVDQKNCGYILKSGKDNAVDGLAAAVISVWEYYLVSHDIELLLKNADA